MLSGQYNPVWEYINVNEVIRTARGEWSQEKSLPESLQQPLIRSLSRYTSLFDLLSVWNKTILHPPTLSSEHSRERAGPLGGAGSGATPKGLAVRRKVFPGARSVELVGFDLSAMGFGSAANTE